MGSDKSKGGVNDDGVDSTKKKMILESHSCCVKNYLKEIGFSTQNNIDELNEDILYYLISDDIKKNILSKFKLRKIVWNYNYKGLHRVLLLTFKCEKCNETKYLRMDKTRRKKNISYGYKSYKKKWWNWEKYPKNSYNFNEILSYFCGASNYYHITLNNCMHFAYEIWNKIK